MSAELKPATLFARIRPVLGDGTSSLIGLHGLTVFLRFFSNIILTRLVAPEAFGVIAIVTSITYVLTMIMDVGLQSYVTRHKTADDGLLQTVWTVRLIRNVVLAAVMFLGADLLAQLYANPEIADAIRVSSCLFLLGGVATMSFATGQRERRVLRISVIEFVRFIVATGVTLVTAYFLRNYWAIIIGMFAGSVFSTLASYLLIPYRPLGFRLNRDHLIDLWRFVRFVLPSSLISIVLTQADKLLVANFFPLDELGKYMLAVMIAQALNGLIGQYTIRVFFPLMAQLQREQPEKLSEAYYDSRRRLWLLLAFGIGGLIGGSQLVVQVLFNDLYLDAWFYLSLVCLGCLGKLITQPALETLVAKGFVRSALIANIIRVVWLLLSAPIAYYFAGPIGMIVAVVLTEAVTIPYFWWRQSCNGFLDILQESQVFIAAVLGGLIGYVATNAVQMLIAQGYLPQF